MDSQEGPSLPDVSRDHGIWDSGSPSNIFNNEKWFVPGTLRELQNSPEIGWAPGQRSGPTHIGTAAFVVEDRNKVRCAFYINYCYLQRLAYCNLISPWKFFYAFDTTADQRKDSDGTPMYHIFDQSGRLICMTEIQHRHPCLPGLKPLFNGVRDEHLLMSYPTSNKLLFHSGSPVIRREHIGINSEVSNRKPVPTPPSQQEAARSGKKRKVQEAVASDDDDDDEKKKIVDQKPLG